MTRGIVIGGRINLNAAGQVSSFNGRVEGTDLARWLLYWDQIVYAGLGRGGASITGNHGDDVKFLQSEGIFRTEVVDIGLLDASSLPPAISGGMRFLGLTESQSIAAVAAARIKLVGDLSKNPDEIWAVGQAGGEYLALPNGSSKRELIDIQLVNCLPVPSGNTPIHEILEFKARYRGELEQLRFALDAMREKILSSCDEQRATKVAMHEISKALTDVHSALSGSRIQTISDTVSLYTHNPSLTFWSMLTGLLSTAGGIPLELGAALGLALPTVARFLKRSVAAPRNLPIFDSDFAYAFEVERRIARDVSWHTSADKLWRMV